MTKHIPGASALLRGTFLIGLGTAALATSATAEDLPVWHDYTYEAQVDVIKTLMDTFEKDHPDVHLIRTQRSFDDLALTLRLAVSAGDGPVVTKVNQGPKDMGAMVKEGMLVPMDGYISEYGWDKLQSPSVIDRDRWSQDGAFGEGPAYGISSLAEVVGLYYNEKVLKDAGVPVPIKSFEDFLAALDTLKDSGVTPMAMGTTNGHLDMHLMAAVAQSHLDASNRAELDDLIYGRGGSWKTDANLKAAQLMQEWADDGYFYDGYQGISATDAMQLFAAGQAAFLTSGTWFFGDLQSNPDIHFMPFPGPKDIENPISVGGVDLAWTITSLAKDKATQDLGAEFINDMVSPQAAEVWAAGGYLPAVALPDDTDVELSGLLEEGVDAWSDLNAVNAIGHYPDWSTPTMLTTITDNLALLMADRQSPEDYVAAVDADYQAYLGSK